MGQTEPPWTPDELRAHAETMIRRHEQLIATYPRLQPGDSSIASVARAYLEAVAERDRLAAENTKLSEWGRALTGALGGIAEVVSGLDGLLSKPADLHEHVAAVVVDRDRLAAENATLRAELAASVAGEEAYRDGFDELAELVEITGVFATGDVVSKVAALRADLDALRAACEASVTNTEMTAERFGVPLPTDSSCPYCLQKDALAAMSHAALLRGTPGEVTDGR